KSVGKGKGEKKTSAILLISDGQFTAGENPIYASESAPVPIYTVLIGDTTKKRDVAVNRIIAPTSAFANTKVPVSVILTQKGFTNQPVRLKLSGEKGVVEEKTVLLSGLENTVTFELEQKDPGEKKFSIQAQPLSGEFSNRNNSSVFFIDILKSKKKVLVISGLADPEVSAVRNALRSNENLEVTVYTQRDANSFLLDQFDPSKHANSDVCLLIGFPNSIASPAFLDRIHQFLTSNCIPVFSILSSQSAVPQLKRYEDLLATEIDNQNSGQMLENAFAYPSSQGLSSSIFKSVSSDLEERLRQAGQLLYPDLGFRAKAGATVLWKLAQNNTKTEKPVFVIGKTGSQKFATLSGAGFWQFWLSQDQNVKALYEQTLLNTVEWLTTKDDVQRFRVEPLAKNFEAADRILFSAILQDELLQPVASAEITLHAKHQKSGEAFKTIFDPSPEAGFYKAGFESLPEGDYTYTAEAKENGKQIGLTTGIFSVSKSDIEFRTPHADAETLREIARRSGGKFYVPATFPEFFRAIKKDIAFQTVEHEEKSSVELANLTTTLLIIVGLLTLEWSLRKFKALP
ncbi:MAG: hypothetical protein HGB19_14180, partial [Chlorobiales bacterium]|nr:hypothetical protein [Chlorobiales bacterium]